MRWMRNRDYVVEAVGVGKVEGMGARRQAEAMSGMRYRADEGS